MTSESPESWSGLAPMPELLAPGVRAPLPVPQAAPQDYRDALAVLLSQADVPRGALVSALSSGSVILHGAQEILAASNRLIATEVTAPDARIATRDLLRTLVVLSRERPAAYVLVQVAEIVASQRQVSADDGALEDRPRLKDLLSPLEDRLASLGVAVHLDVSRLASLLVHLDDVYDDASVQLQRWVGLTSMPLEGAQRLAPAFLRKLYTELVRASFADHLLAEHQGKEGAEPGIGTGLLATLPELLRAFDTI